MRTDLPLNPDLPTMTLAVRPFGLAATLTVVLPTDEPDAAKGALWAFWTWRGGEVRDATIARA